ncbi:universal stress protein [Ponticoccus gilvus]|nr:universal stress protein [Enemella evansiae]
MFRRILLAVDYNDLEGAAKVAEYGGKLAATEGAELHVLTVLPKMGMAVVGSAFGPDHVKTMEAETKAGLSAWAATALPAGLAPQVHVTHGTIYDQIIRMANALKADAIVVGAHSPELRDYLVGPNAARVVRHASQSVLVVR